MRVLQKTELIRIQEVYEQAMNDVCVIMTATDTRDSLNALVKTWADGIPVQCGLNMTGGQKRTPEGLVEFTWDATMRLARDILVSQANRIKMLERYGQPMAEIIYQIVSIAEGPSGLVLRLLKVEPSV
jgi:hypothetical protein